MNKTAIKNYAIWARVQLIESCKQRAFEYGVTEDGNYASNLRTIESRILTDQEVEQRNQLISEIKQKGYAQVMEEAAYTWFNRFIALRFMEVNGYLPSKVRVFTDETGAFRPEILKEAMTIDLEGIDKTKIIDLLEKQDNESLYKYLLITQCNALSGGLPYMFERISNWTELLFPANLLRNDSIVGRMIADIPEEDWTDAVQIIGWMYQYYNSELKDETFALLKKNVKITKERIPAATQLFTPDWIVRYMVENSLGRLWYEGHKDFDKSQWKYYLDEAEQEAEVEAELAKIRAEYAQIKPEEIKVVDPCMGSGHILVYAFDVLMQIYTSAGWSERDAARSIIENNLYGLDIDDRAGQLAYFAVMMKARKYNRRIMNFGLQPNVMPIQDSSFMTHEFIEFVSGNDAKLKNDLIIIKKMFSEAKEYGSILNIPSMRYEVVLDRITDIQNSFVDDVFQIEYRDIAVEKLQPLIKQAMIMSQKYDVVVTNPPYMGASGMSPILSEFVKKHYPESKSDMSTVFMEKAVNMCCDKGFMSMINNPVWMFIGSYEKLRRIFLSNYRIINMSHCGRGIFGSDFGTTAFVLNRTNIINYSAIYLRLFDEPGAVDLESVKQQWFFEKKGLCKSTQDRYKIIPGSPIAYWVGKQFVDAFIKGKLLRDVAVSRVGLQTSNNNYFLRVWFECALDNLYLDCESLQDSIASSKTWYPHNKGGAYRKWYGNQEYVINYKNGGAELSRTDGASTIPKDYVFRPAITYSRVTAGSTSFRLQPASFIFDSACVDIFVNEDIASYLIGFLNTKLTKSYLSVIAPTINTQPGDIAKIPIILDENNEIIPNIVKNCIELEMDDWNAFETSWEFKKHPLL